MLRSLSSGVSGLQQFQGQLDVIGNNIANSSTYGFKGGRADFEDAFNQTVLSGGGVNPLQVGSGVSTATVRTSFENGTISTTGHPSDLAIDGDGFFTVRDVVSGETFVTRAGNFSRDTAGYLVTTQGYRVQGYSDGGLSTRGDIQIDMAGAPEGDVSGIKNYIIDDRGVITVTSKIGNSFPRGQVLLQRFVDPDALVKEGSNLYSGMDKAGPLAQTEVPGTNGLGAVKQNALEGSNVNLGLEFATMITTQRGFQASARIITTADEILQEIVNLKR